MDFARWNLSKYANWEAGEWKLINSEPSKKLTLMLQELQLVVLYEDCALESVSLSQSQQRIKTIYNNGTLVFAIKHQDWSRKFRVLFSSQLDGEQCIVEIRRYLDVTISEGSRPVVDKRQEPLALVLNRILNNNHHHTFPMPESIPEEYPLEGAIRLCILDPGFPALVQRVHSIISKKAAFDTSHKS